VLKEKKNIGIENSYTYYSKYETTNHNRYH